MTAEALTLFDGLALLGSLPESSAEGSTGGTRGSAAPAPGAAPNVRPSDPITSHIAAANNPGRERIAEKVRAILAAHPSGLTDWELFALTGYDPSLRASVIKRRGDAGAVDTGRKRPSPSGRPCVVWALREAVAS